MSLRCWTRIQCWIFSKTPGEKNDLSENWRFQWCQTHSPWHHVDLDVEFGPTLVLHGFASRFFNMLLRTIIRVQRYKNGVCRMYGSQSGALKSCHFFDLSNLQSLWPFWPFFSGFHQNQLDILNQHLVLINRVNFEPSKSKDDFIIQKIQWALSVRDYRTVTRYGQTKQNPKNYKLLDHFDLFILGILQNQLDILNQHLVLSTILNLEPPGPKHIEIWVKNVWT